MTHSSEFRDQLFTELQFGTRHLGPLRRLYRQMRANCLGTAFAFNEVPGLHPNMTWCYASNPRTLESFRRCIDDTPLRECLSIVHGDPQLLAACFVVVKGDTPLSDYHVDYGEREIPVGSTGTMLTPLLAFDEEFGHLEYRGGPEELEYRYQFGDAILFDGKFEHRSQAFVSESALDRILVSWSIASSDDRYQFAIRRAIDSQVQLLNPSGPGVLGPGVLNPLQTTTPSSTARPRHGPMALCPADAH